MKHDLEGSISYNADGYTIYVIQPRAKDGPSCVMAILYDQAELMIPALRSFVCRGAAADFEGGVRRDDLMDLYNQATDQLQVPGVEIMIVSSSRVTIYPPNIPVEDQLNWAAFLFSMFSITIYKMDFLCAT